MLDLEQSYYKDSSDVSIGRSTFDGLSHSHKTTFKAGDLVPVYLEEVLPGDTFQIDTSFLVRMATPIFPVMDNAYLDLYYFYVPNRLVWDHYKEFLGENTNAPWVQTVQYSVPQIKFDKRYEDIDFIDGKQVNVHRRGPKPGSIMNRFGVPSTLYPGTPYVYTDTKGEQHTITPTFSVSDLPNRAYNLIWNEFFRNQNMQYPRPVYKDDSNRDYAVDRGLTYDYGSTLLKVGRFHDYFSSCLPAPQKSDPVTLSLFSESFLPVTSNADFRHQVDVNDDPLSYSVKDASSNTWNQLESNSGTNVQYIDGGLAAFGSASTSGTKYNYTIDNLGVNIANGGVLDVATLRNAFAIQRFYELQARSGSRFREIMKSFYGVTVPDARVQIPEYLGGTRVPINMDQVLQTSSTDSVSPQGNTAGYSLTTDTESSFTKSFVEPGMIIGVCCVRVEHTYPESVRPYLFRKNRFDFYWPQFANLSDQAVMKKSIYPTALGTDDEVFGYQEAWADYRYRPNMLSGGFSNVQFEVDQPAPSSSKYVSRQSSLAQAWTYADFYSVDYVNLNELGDDPYNHLKVPTLSDGWMAESSNNVGQTLAVPSEDQFIADFHFNVKATRPMPVRSIPGLIDHH